MFQDIQVFYISNSFLVFNMGVNFGNSNSITVSDASMLHEEEDKKLTCIQLIN